MNETIGGKNSLVEKQKGSQMDRQKRFIHKQVTRWLGREKNMLTVDGWMDKRLDRFIYRARS